MTEDRVQKEIEENNNHLIKTKIQPGVDAQGGIVKLDNFNVETGVATMLMSGSCSGCASSAATLKQGIENMLKHYIPEVKSVEGVDDPAYNNPYYKKEINPLAPTMSYEEMLNELEQYETEDKKENGK